MTLIEAAERILSEKRGISLTTQEIVEKSLSLKLISPKSTQPWVHLAAAIRKDNKSSLLAGKKPRFIEISGKWSLS